MKRHCSIGNALIALLVLFSAGSMAAAWGAPLLQPCGKRLELAGSAALPERELPDEQVEVRGRTRAFSLVDRPEGIEDLRRIPQDIRPFAVAVKKPLTDENQPILPRQFAERHFSPWTKGGPLFSIRQTVQNMADFAAKSWFAENRMKVEPERVQALLALADTARFPSLNQPAIIVQASFLRALPSNRPFYETADDFPFDMLQNSEVKPNDPARVLHISVDGAWLYIETSYTAGWIETPAVRLADVGVRRRMTDSPRVVVVRDFAVLRDDKGKALSQPKIGTLYPLVKEEERFWVVNAAVTGEGEQAVLATARIAKEDARPHPLPFTADHVALIGAELLKAPYGWGELYRDRDCSATTRDFFLPFGVWLPRNSREQLKSGPFVSLANLPNAEKEKIIREQGAPFQTLLYRKGHIMLYAGLHEGKPVALHDTWALRFRQDDGPEEKLYIGRTVITSLEPGKELKLTRGTNLDHIEGMLILPALPVNPDGEKR